MIIAAALVIAGAIALPHVLRLEHAHASSAATMWFCALALRAVITVAAVLFIIIVLPTTQLFSLVTHWCWHAVLPVATAHLGLDGHRVGDAATVIPALLLAATVIWVAFGVARAARMVRAFVRQAELGPGPDGSVMVGGPEVVVAVAGLHRPRVVISAGALIALDDDELAASLDHERGHIERRHRFVLLTAQFLRTLGRPLPGTRTAMRELTFHLERDADAFAIRKTHDPLALASAICKAASAPFLGTNGVTTALGGGAASRRVRELARGAPVPGSTKVVRALAMTMVAVTVAAAAALPAAAASTGGPPDDERHCTT